MKITFIELDPQYSMVTHQLVLTLISDFFLLVEIATTWQTDSVAYKLKPRLFHNFAISLSLSCRLLPWYELCLTIYDKEMLVVIRELENQRHVLKDTEYKFKVWMNYKNLEYFMKVQKLNKRQAYQILYLSRFNFTLMLQQPLAGTALIVCLLQQSSPMGYLVVGITRELNKKPSLYYPLYIHGSQSVLQQYLSGS